MEDFDLYCIYTFFIQLNTLFSRCNPGIYEHLISLPQPEECCQACKFGIKIMFAIFAHVFAHFILNNSIIIHGVDSTSVIIDHTKYHIFVKTTS